MRRSSIESKVPSSDIDVRVEVALRDGAVQHVLEPAVPAAQERTQEAMEADRLAIARDAAVKGAMWGEASGTESTGEKSRAQWEQMAA